MHIPWRTIGVATLLYAFVLAGAWAPLLPAPDESYGRVILLSALVLTTLAALGFGATLRLARPPAPHGSVALLLILSSFAGAVSLLLLYVIGGVIGTFVAPAFHNPSDIVLYLGLGAAVLCAGVGAGAAAAIGVVHAYGGPSPMHSLFRRHTE